jgi:ribose/xylose/arabinose/galactoside ABC-type transport system permease subunit
MNSAETANKVDRTEKGKKSMIRFIKRNAVFLILIVLVVILSMLESNFFTLANLINILRQCAVYAILAYGMTFVMISGRIDLSVGAIVALCSSSVALLITRIDMNMWLAVALTILIGGACGFVNGVSITKLRVPFFIATAGMMYIARGIALIITKENPVSGLPSAFGIFGGKASWLIPPQVIIAAILFVIFYIVLNHTRLGRYTYAIGSNQVAAKQSGIAVDRFSIIIFTICGLCAGVVGVIMASRLQIGSPVIADGWELDAIAVVAIGGTSLMGGSGSIVKTIVGALVLTVIRVGLNILGISTSLQKVIIGVVLIAVVALDMLTHKGSK